jgi:hypothetical protein
LALIFGDNFTFTLEAPTLPGKPRTFNRFSDYAALTVEGRLYTGFHYRNSSMVGLELGRKVAEYVVKNALTPGPTLAGTVQSGQFQLWTRNAGSALQRVETSADLQTWVPLTNYVSSDATLQIVDPAASSAGHKFYRIGAQ